MEAEPEVIANPVDEYDDVQGVSEVLVRKALEWCSCNRHRKYFHLAVLKRKKTNRMQSKTAFSMRFGLEEQDRSVEWVRRMFELHSQDPDYDDIVVRDNEGRYICYLSDIISDMFVPDHWPMLAECRGLLDG